MLLSDSSGPRGEYSLVEIRVFAAVNGGTTYPVELDVLGWRRFAPGTLQLDLARLMGLTADPAAYGRALGQALFAAEAVGDAFRETVAAVEAQNGALRVRLRIDPPELHGLGWERILAPIDGQWLPLGAAAATPLSRFVLGERWERPAPVTARPLRVLTVIAAPVDLDDYGLDTLLPEERAALRATFAGLPEVVVTTLESGTSAPPTLNALRAALAEGHSLVHVLCHGAATPGGTVLYLEREDGAVDPVKAERLLGAFSLVQTPPALCFLAACETAARGRHDAFVPLGPALVAQGHIQAVIAMSDRVGIDTARLFTGHFYTRLLTHGVVDLAMNEARALVQDEWDWGVPVLFTQLHDSQLLDFPVGAPVARLGDVASAATHALRAARLHEEGERLVEGLERLLAAFETSFRTLVRLGSDFRAAGSDPESFPATFGAYYLGFKDYYDQETFTDEQALVRQMIRLKAQTLPRLRPLLDAETFGQLETALDQMAVNRAGLIEGFGEFLEPLNAAVDEIKALLDAGDVTGAIARKQAFEMQISPALRRSKTLLGEIGAGIGLAQAA